MSDQSSAMRGRTRSVARAPLASVRAQARVVSLTEAHAGTVTDIMRQLPDPDELPPGTLVILPGRLSGTSSLTRSVLAVFGRTKIAPRTLRCTALVARGYVNVGAAQDDTHEDLAWGFS